MNKQLVLDRKYLEQCVEGFQAMMVIGIGAFLVKTIFDAMYLLTVLLG